MNLEEIRKQLHSPSLVMREGEDIGEYAQRLFDSTPRVPYKELPKSLQDRAREMVNLRDILSFLREPPQREGFETLFGEYVDSFYPAKDGETDERKKERESECEAEKKTVLEGGWNKRIEKLLTRTRNLAVYRIEGRPDPESEEYVEILVPTLYGDGAWNAFVEACGERARAMNRKAAPVSSDIVLVGSRQHVVSAPGFDMALTPLLFDRWQQRGFIAKAAPVVFERIRSEGGKLTFDDVRKDIYETSPDDLKNLDVPLLWQVYTAASKSQVSGGSGTITVDAGEFFKRMKIDQNGAKTQDVLSKMDEFEKWVGIIRDTGEVYRLFVWLKIDPAANTMQFAVPYMFRLIEAVEEDRRIERKRKGGEIIAYTNPTENRLCHSSLANERNKAAVVLVYEITNGILQRGSIPDAKTYRKKNKHVEGGDIRTYSVSYRSLVAGNALLRARIENYRDTSDKNRALRRAFSKAYELIEKKTDTRLCFHGLEFKWEVPTMTTLDDAMVITHRGENAEYNPPS